MSSSKPPASGSKISLRYLPLGLVLFLLSLSVAWHWNDRLLNSHMFRQTHTAQNAEMYTLLGWNPLRSYYRFTHKPGMNVLELPVYQSLDAGLSGVAAISIDQAGRLINVVCGLLFALGLVLLNDRLSRARKSERDSRPLSLGLVFSLPLLFGISQWVLADLLACALAVWALIFFESAGRRSVRAWWPAVCLAVSLGLSFAIKPTISVAAAPFYALLMWDGRKFRLRPLLRVFCAGLAVVAGLGWFWYGQRLNQQLGGQYKITDASYYVGRYALDPVWLGKLAARIAMYVVGPGTLMLLAYCAFMKVRLSLQKPTRPLLLACVASGALYTLLFLNLNVRHNYYQLPLLMPVAVLLAGLIAQLPRTRGVCVVVAAAVAMNLAISQWQLLRIDQNLNRAIEGLRQDVATGIQLPELTLFTDVDAAGPVFAYYLERYVFGLPAEESARAGQSEPWFAACDLSLGGKCQQQIMARLPECSKLGKNFGRYWTCVPPAKGSYTP